MTTQRTGADWPRDATERGAVAIVDVGAIEHNTRSMLAFLDGPAVMAVVKADAYGHGLVASARAALEGGAAWLGVALPQEALALRDSGITAPVLCWLPAAGRDWRTVIQRGIDVTVSSTEALADLGAAAAATGHPARIQLKVDTGLSRNGATLAAWPALLAQVSAAQSAGTVEVTGVWSHFAAADTPADPSVPAQLEAFETALASLARYDLDPPLRHLANSAAAIAIPSSRLDLVRLGITLYGLSPGIPTDGVELRPAMTLRARLAGVKQVDAGVGVSYGHAYRTSQPTVLGLVPLGYADGIPRIASSLGPVLVEGRRTTIAGRVCMDQFVIDLGPQSAARPGDDVTLFGAGGAPSADDWAEVCSTIGYEIVTRIGPRVPRHYVRSDR